MLPPPVVAAPVMGAIVTPQMKIDQYKEKLKNQSVTLQNLSACRLTNNDYDRLRSMVDRRIFADLPVAVQHVFEMEPAVSSDAVRPWMFSRRQHDAGNRNVARMRHSLAGCPRVNPVLFGDIISEMLPNIVFVAMIWLYVAHLLHLKM